MIAFPFVPPASPFVPPVRPQAPGTTASGKPCVGHYAGKGKTYLYSLKDGTPADESVLAEELIHWEQAQALQAHGLVYYGGKRAGNERDDGGERGDSLETDGSREGESMTKNDGNRNDYEGHQLYVYERGQCWGRAAYTTIDCGRVSACSSEPPLEWEAWTLDSLREMVQCAIPTTESIARGTDGALLIGGEPVETDPIAELRSRASNRLRVVLDSELASERLPLFVSTIRSANPTVYRVVIRMHVQKLSELPDTRAAEEFRLFLLEVFSKIGGVGSDVGGFTTDAVGLCDGLHLPIEYDHPRGPVPGVLELDRLASSGRWYGRLCLLDHADDVGPGTVLRRTTSITLGGRARQFQASICTIESASAVR